MTDPAIERVRIADEPLENEGEGGGRESWSGDNHVATGAASARMRCKIDMAFKMLG